MPGHGTIVDIFRIVRLHQFGRRAGFGDAVAGVGLQRAGGYSAWTFCAIGAVGWPAERWQTDLLLVKLPSLEVIAACVLAELHGRMGYFPTIVRLRPVAGSVSREYELAELIGLQDVRDAARLMRREGSS